MGRKMFPRVAEAEGNNWKVVPLIRLQGNRDMKKKKQFRELTDTHLECIGSTDIITNTRNSVDKLKPTRRHFLYSLFLF